MSLPQEHSNNDDQCMRERRVSTVKVILSAGQVSVQWSECTSCGTASVSNGRRQQAADRSQVAERQPTLSPIQVSRTSHITARTSELMLACPAHVKTLHASSRRRVYADVLPSPRYDVTVYRSQCRIVYLIRRAVHSIHAITQLHQPPL